jgi:aconitate hydratase 2/2-methylisocitrate dehydratase
MGNKKKAEKRGYSVLLLVFPGRVVEDSEGKKENLYFPQHLLLLSTILGRTPTMDEYKAAVKVLI